MRTSVNVVVTCTNRKRAEPTSALLMRSLQSQGIEGRAAEWSRRVRAASDAAIPAAELYSGEHWSVVRGLPAQAAKHAYDLHVWVASAGHGVISLEERIPPYGATLSRGHADSVLSANEEPADWWSALTSREPSSPRNLAALARRFPSRPIIVAVSPPYLKAMARDLVEAADCLDSPSSLSVLCAGTASTPEVASFRVPCDARLQHAAGGGTRVSLNVRLVGLALDQLAGQKPSFDRISSAFTTLLASAPPVSVYDRAKLGDEDIRGFIRSALKTEPGVSKTGLLRKLRDQGQACEQNRFGELFREVKRDHS